MYLLMYADLDKSNGNFCASVMRMADFCVMAMRIRFTVRSIFTRHCLCTRQTMTVLLLADAQPLGRLTSCGEDAVRTFTPFQLLKI